MKTLLILLAVLLIAAGVAVGLMNIFSPGTVIVGLNLDVAATLFTGGCVLLGLGVVAGYLSVISVSEVNDGADNDNAPATSPQSDLPDFMVPPKVSASAAAAVAEASSAGFGDVADKPADVSADTAVDFAKDAEPAVDDAVDSTFSAATETATEVAEDVADTTEPTAEKTRDDLSSFFAKAPEDDPDPDADTPPVFTGAHGGPSTSDDTAAKDTKPEASDTRQDAGPGKSNTFSGSSDKATDKPGSDEADTPASGTEETSPDAKKKAATEGPKLKESAVETPSAEAQGSQPDEADAATASDDVEAASDDSPEALPQEEELFVVEERVIRERPARLLSDGTVEAETDEGWMRFENIEHVEEYLDAMKATA